jgi:hypothetical protein
MLLGYGVYVVKQIQLNFSVKLLICRQDYELRFEAGNRFLRVDQPHSFLRFYWLKVPISNLYEREDRPFNSG